VDKRAYAVLNGEVVEVKGLRQEFAVFLRGLGDVYPEQALPGLESGFNLFLSEVTFVIGVGSWLLRYYFTTLGRCRQQGMNKKCA